MTWCSNLIDAATGVFIAQGYRRTQMSDIAEAMGLAKGTVYLETATAQPTALARPA